MALTETRQDTDQIEGHTGAGPERAADGTTLDGVLGSGDHKTIGRLWIGSSVVLLLGALVLAVVVSIETIDLGGFAIADEESQFVQIFSLGRDLLMFAAVVPLFVGVATYVVPLQVGSSSIAFPRGAAAAFWTWLLSTIVLILTYVMNGGPGGGRVDYVVLWTLSLGAMVVALLWAMIAIATTVLGARTAGMSLERVPVSTWSFFVFSVGGLLALPVLLAELVLAYVDVKYGFLPTKADRSSLIAIVDSVNLAPAIYWLGIPTLGIATEAIAVHTGRPARFHKSILAVIGFYGFVAYGADMLSFAWRGRPIAFDNGVLVVATLAAALPVLLVLGLAGESLGKGSPKLRAPLAASVLAGVVLLAGSATAVLGLVDPVVGFIETVSGEEIDFSFDLTNTTFQDGVRAMVIGAAILSLIGAVHHWGHKIWGRSLDDRIGLLSVLAAAGGALLWGIPLVVAGFLDQSRLPLPTEDPESGVELLNVVSTIGVGLLAGAAALLLLNVAGVLAGKVGSGAEPWRGLTLEWATSSPPASGNFGDLPAVVSATPLADFVEVDQPADGSAAEAASASSEGEEA